MFYIHVTTSWSTFRGLFLMMSSFRSSVESIKQKNLCSQGRTFPLWCHSFPRRGGGLRLMLISAQFLLGLGLGLGL
jgi:hypothetical protein